MFRFLDNEFIKRGFRFCTDHPTTYVRVGKNANEKLFIMIYKNQHDPMLSEIRFTLYFDSANKSLMCARNTTAESVFKMMQTRTDWFELMVDDLCNQLKQIIYDDFTKI